MVVVIIISLSGIAIGRPPYYGCILLVLLGLDPLCIASKEMVTSRVFHDLKNAMFMCLKCTHPNVFSWQDHFSDVLERMKIGMPKEILNQNTFCNGERKRILLSEKEVMPPTINDPMCVSLAHERAVIIVSERVRFLLENVWGILSWLLENHWSPCLVL